MKAYPTTTCSGAFARLTNSACNVALLSALLFFVTLRPSEAGSATWKANPATGDWNTANNWTPKTVPNGSADTATFAASSQTAISLSAPIEVNGITYNSGASAFTTTVPQGLTSTLSGAGITNNSGVTQTLVATTADNVAGGAVVFSNNATAGDATLIAYGQSQNSGSGGRIQFLDNSNGGTARIAVYGNSFTDLRGTLDVSAHNAPGIAIGSIEGTGVVSVGTNNLTVGGNKSFSSTFAGLIHDDFQGGNVGRGSFTKVGQSKLTVSGLISCFGGTTLQAGSIWLDKAKNQQVIQGPVQVKRGTLGGTGAIWAYGDVVIGNGSTPGAKLLPGTSTSKPGTLEVINGRLIFNSLSTYECVLGRNMHTASQIYVGPQEVIINSNATFAFLDHATGTVPPGTVFTVINNAGPDPIMGTFSNLPDGSTFTSNGNTYQANYEGGDGNDLTLIVVPNS